AGTYQEALSHPELSRTQVLICDIGLPDGSGWDLLPELRARMGMGSAYAVAITARGRPGDEARSLARGFQAHLAKPFAPNQLLELLKRCPAGGGATDPRR
ncbi:MAG: response regulator, partial [Verrucomicrobia bacterium]|nr:response regulator [Verrucomicrobiota bacterium]